jgi:membrane protein YqaA with SNARE-associated domain
MIYFILFCSAFLSATLFPFGSEALFIYDIKNGYNIYLLLFFATFGNTLGSLVNYFLGKKGEEFLEKKSLVKSKYITKSKNYFQKYGFLTLFLSWMPIIGDPITFIAGVLKYNFKKFLLIVTIAKFSRYFFIYLIL